MANQVGAGAEGTITATTVVAPVPSQETVATAGTPVETKRDRSNDPDFIAATAALQSQRDKAVNERDRAISEKRQLEMKVRALEEQTLSANTNAKAAHLREKGMDEKEIGQFLQSDLEQARALRKQSSAELIRLNISKEFKDIAMPLEDIQAIPLGEDPGAYEDRLRLAYERKQLAGEVAEARRLKEEALKNANTAELRARDERGADRLSGHAEPESTDDVEAAYKRELKAAAHKPNEVKAVLRKYRGRVPDLS